MVAPPAPPECDVCLLEYSVDRFPMSLRCGHTFCRPCLIQLQRPTCPTCRTSLGIRADSDATPNYALLRQIQSRAATGSAAGGYAYSIRVMTLQGEPMWLIVKATDTVRELQQMINVRTGVPPEQQRLIYGGKQLDPNGTLTLGGYGVTAKSCVQLVMRMLGGCLSQV